MEEGGRGALGIVTIGAGERGKSLEQLRVAIAQSWTSKSPLHR
jgi:hypothetical protein